MSALFQPTEREMLTRRCSAGAAKKGQEAKYLCHVAWRPALPRAV